MRDRLRNGGPEGHTQQVKGSVMEYATPRTHPELRGDIVGVETKVPVLDGSERRYVFLDNAASTPTFRTVLRVIEEFLPWYSGVHRGTGFKSLLATEVFDHAHERVARFVGADLATNTVVFGKNTTECVNKLSNRFSFVPGDIVLTTMMEHHSNDLPWRRHARVIHVGVGPDGHPDLQQMRDILRKEGNHVRLVAITGASNITGICSPIHEIARWAHEAGAKIFVDAAQLAPHRPVSMLPDDDPEHIDFLALSAHKMYAPFGTGALVGPKEFFERGAPDMVGGGVVEVVTLDEAHWNHPPHKEEAGSPNVIGGVALAAALEVLDRIGMETIASHERALLEYAYAKLRPINGLTLYGPTDHLDVKVGTIVFNLDHLHHSLVAAILSTEGAIGVRDGCFCAHPYVKELLHVPPDEDRAIAAEMLSGDRTRLPGMVRASLGCYSNEQDIDALAEMLTKISRGEFRGTYRQEKSTGAFHAEGFRPDFSRYFRHFTEPVERRIPSEAS